MKIVTVKDFGEALKQGPYSSYGSYPFYFITADGGSLSFATAWNERANIAHAIAVNNRSDGWRVIGSDVNWEDPDLHDSHTGERIESAYAEDEAQGKPAKIPASYSAWYRRVKGIRE